MRRLLLALCIATPALAGCIVEEDDSNGPDTPEGPPAFCDFPCSVGVAEKPWPEYEPSIAINPKDPLNVIVGVHDDPRAASEYFVADPQTGGPAAYTPGYIGLSAQVTLDGGATWSHQFLPFFTTAPEGSQWNLICNMGDPVVVFGPDGTAHYFGLGIGCGDPSFYSSTSYLFVTKSTDKGRTWSEPVFVWQAPGVVQFQDKQWAAVDSVSGKLAVSWSAYDGGVYSPADTSPVLGPHEQVVSVDLLVSVSGDGGATWSRPPSTVTRSSAVAMTDVWEESSVDVNYFSMPAWGPAGELYVAYRTCADSCIKVAKSIDGGVTWLKTPVAETRPDTARGPQGTFVSQGVLDVDRSGGAHEGRVYLSYKAWRDSDYDVVVVWSDDGATSWSAPLALNDNALNDTGDQFMHWMDVDAAGVVHAMFFDRRSDPANLLIQAAYARFDPATGVLVNELLEEAWNPAPNNLAAPRYGHYNSISVVDDTVAIAWTWAGPPKEDQEEISRRAGYDMDIHAAILTTPPSP